jgi:hypothetical protein
MRSRQATGGQPADVVVAGSGVAGLCAAIEAAEAGARVVVLEAQSTIGGASAMSGAGCCLVDTPLQVANGIADSVELALSDWAAVSRIATLLTMSGPRVLENDAQPLAYANADRGNTPPLSGANARFPGSTPQYSGQERRLAGDDPGAVGPGPEQGRHDHSGCRGKVRNTDSRSPWR